MNKYQNGDQLPAFRLKLGEADILDLPAGLTSDYTIILFYRGHWCPFCRRLLDKYEQRIDQFRELNTSIIAASIDSLEHAQEVAASLSFPVAWGVERELANQLGSFWDESRNFMQPTEFIVDKSGLIYSSTYSSSPVGRTDSDEALAAIRFYIERDKN